MRENLGSHLGFWRPVLENCCVFFKTKQSKNPYGKNLSISHVGTKFDFKEAKLRDLCCILEHHDTWRHTAKCSQPQPAVETGGEHPGNKFWEILVHPCANHLPAVQTEIQEQGMTKATDHLPLCLDHYHPRGELP